MRQKQRCVCVCIGHQGFGSVVGVVLHISRGGLYPHTCDRFLIELELSFHPYEENLSGNALL